MKYLEIEDLTRLSSEVVQGQILSTYSYWDDSHTRILTAVRLQVDDCYKGSSKRGSVITISQLGGEIDGIRQDFSGRPLFKAGENVVLFARAIAKKELHLVGLKQGKLIIRGNEAQRELGGLRFVDAAVGTTATPAPGASSDKQLKAVQLRYSLNELRERVGRVR